MNVKWQNVSDSIMNDLGLTQSLYSPQHFYTKEARQLLLIVAKIVNDLKITGTDDHPQ